MRSSLLTARKRLRRAGRRRARRRGRLRGPLADERIALVLAGGGARGAYEAGALSVLLADLERLGQRPAIVVGTSVGALNAAFVAAAAHRPAAEVADEAFAIWSDLRYGQVPEPLAAPWSALRAAQHFGLALGVRAQAWSVLDRSSLRRTLLARVAFARLRLSVASGLVHAAAVVATSARTNRSVVFHQGGIPPFEHDDRRGIDHARIELGAEHVLASAAIPDALTGAGAASSTATTATSAASCATRTWRRSGGRRWTSAAGTPPATSTPVHRRTPGPSCPDAGRSPRPATAARPAPSPREAERPHERRALARRSPASARARGPARAAARARP